MAGYKRLLVFQKRLLIIFSDCIFLLNPDRYPGISFTRDCLRFKYPGPPESALRGCIDTDECDDFNRK